MSHRNEERGDPRSSIRPSRQELQHTTTHRTQPIPPSRQNVDRYSMPISHLRAGGYGKCLDLFIQVNVKKIM